MKNYLTLSALALSLFAGAAEVRWIDGSVAPAPVGKLLSDNQGFYGEVILTGTTYRYQSELEAGSGDSAGDTDSQRGRRLLNGDIGNQDGFFRDLNPPRLLSPGTVEFDLQSRCQINEITLHPAPGNYTVKIATPEGPVSEKNFTISGTHSVERIFFPEPLSARQVTLSIASADGTPVSLSEVWFWGDAPERDRASRALPGFAVYDIAYVQSVPGITNTTIDEREFRRWQRTFERSVSPLPPVVWSEFPAWGPLSKNAIQPSPEAVAAPVRLTLVRNEHEAALLVLTNTSLTAGYSGEINFSGFTDAAGRPATGLTAEPMAMAALPSRDFGVQLTTLISAANKPGAEVLARYAANGATLAEFPRIELNPAGNFFCWLTVASAADCPAGLYRGNLSAGAGAGKEIEVEVLDCTLADTAPRFVNYWWKPIGQYPFRSLDWNERDAASRLELGVTVLPEKVLGDETSLGAIMLKQQPLMLFGFWQGEYGGRLWAAHHMNHPWGKDGLPPEDAEKIRHETRSIADFARRRGLTDAQWYFDMADEPAAGNYRLFGEVARVMHESVPEAMISCNPCSWFPGGFEPDETIYPLLKDWYADTIAISLPAQSLVDYPQSGKLFSAPRPYNGFYEVVTSRAKSESRENVNYPRMMVWDCIAHGFNSWNLYSYYDSHMGEEPWDDMNATAGTFCLVYPGPNGPVPTRQYMAAREAFEDYLLMALLKQRAPERHAEVLRAWREDGLDYTELRDLIYQYLKESAR